MNDRNKFCNYMNMKFKKELESFDINRKYKCNNFSNTNNQKLTP